MSVNVHWRCYAIKDFPHEDNDQLHDWIMACWRKKDELLENFQRHGKFPADLDAVHIESRPQEKVWKTLYISTEVQQRMPLEFLQMFAPVAAAALVRRIFVQIFDRIFGK